MVSFYFCFWSHRFTEKLKEMYRDFPDIPCIQTCIASSIINITNQNLHWNTIIIQSPFSTLFYGSGKMLMIYTHHHNIIQSIFTGYLWLKYTSVFNVFGAYINGIVILLSCSSSTLLVSRKTTELCKLNLYASNLL